MRFALALIVASLACAEPPRVTKVEPPNWWAGHSVNPVRLLVRGSGLRGATVAGELETRNVRANEAGTYLFVDVAIPLDARPGPVKLTVRTRDGGVLIPFEIVAPPAPAGRYQGVTPDDFIYLIMPDRYSDGDPTNNDPPLSRGLFNRSLKRFYHGGDFQGVINRLPYLKNLGVTAIWLTPIYDNANRSDPDKRYDGEPFTDYHGYGAIDFYGVEEHFGDLAKFRELVDTAHRLGMKVVQDQVANHTGPAHPWVDDPPLPNWFHGTAAKHLGNNGQIAAVADPYTPPGSLRVMLDGWFANILPDLNQEEPEVARYLIQNTLWWIGMTGFDAVRQDTLPYVPRTFWRDWMAAIKREHPRLNVIGETLDADPALVAFFQGGRKQADGIDTGIDTLFDFPLYFAIRGVFAGETPMRALASVLAHDHLYPDPTLLVTFVGLHDVDRFMSAKRATLERLKMAFTFVLTTRGIPLIYYGDEIAMQGGSDPDNRRDFPAPSFDSHSELQDHIARLAKLRAANDCLRRGELKNLRVDAKVYAYTRSTRACVATVVLNIGAEPVTIGAISTAPNAAEVRVQRR